MSKPDRVFDFSLNVAKPHDIPDVLRSAASTFQHLVDLKMLGKDSRTLRDWAVVARHLNEAASHIHNGLIWD